MRKLQSKDSRLYYISVLSIYKTPAKLFRYRTGVKFNSINQISWQSQRGSVLHWRVIRTTRIYSTVRKKAVINLSGRGRGRNGVYLGGKKEARKQKHATRCKKGAIILGGWRRTRRGKRGVFSDIEVSVRCAIKLGPGRVVRQAVDSSITPAPSSHTFPLPLLLFHAQHHRPDPSTTSFARIQGWIRPPAQGIDPLWRDSLSPLLRVLPPSSGSCFKAIYRPRVTLRVGAARMAAFGHGQVLCASREISRSAVTLRTSDT